MTAKKYIYPDIDDKLIVKFIELYELEKGGWEKEEASVFEIADKYLHNFSGTNSSFLDAGCGTGRLIPVFDKYFSTVIAIDPDETRLEKAKDTVKKAGIESKTILLNNSIEEFTYEHRFNTILCAYVLHHVSNAVAEGIIKKLYSMLEEDGILILLTAWSAQVYDLYSKSYFDKDKLDEKEINITEYENIVRENAPEILPVHSFCTDHLKRIIESNGFELVNIKPYHNTKVHTNPKDIMVVLRKPKKSPVNYN